jgi:hypothetical protein
MTDTSIAPTKAAEKVVTLNPFITLPKYQNSNPFTTRENNPSVTMFIGRVKIFITGLINILNKVKHAPTIRATQIGAKLIPEIIFVVAKTAKDKIIQCKIIFIK